MHTVSGNAIILQFFMGNTNHIEENGHVLEKVVNTMQKSYKASASARLVEEKNPMVTIVHTSRCCFFVFFFDFLFEVFKGSGSLQLLD